MTGSAPGNLLLFGEYTATESGGLGVALGAGPRARCTVRPADGFRVSARFGEQELQWPDSPLPLASAAVEELAVRNLEPPRIDVQIDTTAFYRGGRKLGFGSSAAASLLLAAALLDYGGGRPAHGSSRGSGSPDGTPAAHDSSRGPGPAAGGGRHSPSPTREAEAAGPPSAAWELYSLALAIHRRLQGGRGSGYDVAASLWGGTISFVGGAAPRAERVELPWLPGAWVIPGAAAVETKGAVGAYKRWKESDPEGARSFVSRSNQLVSRFLESNGWEEAIEAGRDARDLYVDLGRRIGVPAAFSLPAPVAKRVTGPCAEESLLKSVGAGAEMGLLLTPCDLTGEELESVGAIPIDTRERGLVWE